MRTLKSIVVILLLVITDGYSQTDFNCRKQLGINIEVWNHTAPESLIGEPSESVERYVRARTWDRHVNYHPKKFDLKLIVINKDLIYQKPHSSLSSLKLNVSMSLKVGEDNIGEYPLNSKIVENQKLITNRVISSDDLNNSDKLEIWLKDIDFETFYNKYAKENHFINQVIFKINFETLDGSTACSYEYAFILNSPH